MPDIRAAEQELGTAEHFARFTAARRCMTADAQAARCCRRVVSELGLSTSALAFDALRLRAVPHRGHHVPEAAAAYYLHRDTWYANPQTQLNWWIPLHDVDEQTTIRLFPRLFRQPLSNDSAEFDYNVWRQQVGWARPGGAALAVHPRALEIEQKELCWRPRVAAAEIIVFSAAHLHGPALNEGGATRFSADFRTVHIEDERDGCGAPNVDNASLGSALLDYALP